MMPDTLGVLFLAAEAEPFVKVGGLGDVAGSLPRALRSLSDEVTGGTKVDVRLILPMHPVIKLEAFGVRPLTIFPLNKKNGDIQVQVYETELDGMPVYFIGGEPVNASGSVYSSDAALDREKYTFFSLASLEFLRQSNWKPNILHANDWHTALACYALLLNRWEGKLPGLNSILTLHNLPYMGPDISATLDSYNLPVAQTGLPEWAHALSLPLGLWAADSIVAVSPTYAREILTPEFGCGLQDYLHARRESLNGILNGIDVESFNPAIDPAVGVNFGVPTLDKKVMNKSALQVRLNLPQVQDVPLIGVVSRLDKQKGIDLIPPALRRIKDMPWQAVLLGTGDPKLEESIRRFQTEFPDRVRGEFRYDDGLARQIYAGSDLFLMPSRYEPCGLSQLIAMRYGSLPLVNSVGGLKDTIIPNETGFAIEKATSSRLSTAIKKALTLFQDRAQWEIIQKAAMSQDFSWSISAKQYFQLYQRVNSQVITH